MIKPSVGKYVRKRHINPSLDEIFETILFISWEITQVKKVREKLAYYII
jgi:hypothetical protein